MEILLGKKEVLDLGKNMQGLNITCTEGSCWVTQSGDSRDHVLDADSNFLTKGGGQLIITATEASRIKLHQEKKTPLPLLRRIIRTEFSVARFS